MLNSKYKFVEASLKKETGVIKVIGVPRAYFSCIIQYIYSDHFYISRHDLEYFLKLLTFADYFLLPRLVEICSSYLKNFVNLKNALHILLVAHSHNAIQLEQYCINYIIMNERDIMNSREYKNFKRRAQAGLLKVIEESILREKQESFVQNCISNFKQHNDARVTDSRLSSASAEELIQSTEREIDFEHIFGTTQYIYMEEHFKFETYDQETLSSFVTLDLETPKKKQKEGLILDQFEEEKKISIAEPHQRPKRQLMVNQSSNKNTNQVFFDEKENSHPNIPSQTLHSKKKAMLGQSS